MYQTLNRVLQSAAELNLPVTEFCQIGPRRWKTVLRQVFNRFATTHKTGVAWLWECLRDRGASIESNYGIGLITPLFEPRTPVWLMVEDKYGDKKHGNYWVFESTYGAALAVLDNLFGIEYYIVDRKFEWMLLEMHHDVVIGIGAPAESLIRGLREKATRKAVA